ncbi:hypothetical protein, partial [Gluconobacter kanchanaburiensis]
RAKVTPETLNQSAKKLKSPDKRINQQFFDPSISVSNKAYFSAKNYLNRRFSQALRVREWRNTFRCIE